MHLNLELAYQIIQYIRMCTYLRTSAASATSQRLCGLPPCMRAEQGSKDPKIQNTPHKTYRARDERGELREDDSWPWAGRRVSKLPLLALSGWSFDTCHVALLHLRFHTCHVALLHLRFRVRVLQNALFLFFVFTISANLAISA